MGVREIPVDEITQVVRRLCIEANTVLGDDAVAALETSLAIEESPVGQDVFRQLIRNAEIARTEGIPLCQDTGMVVVFLEIGQDVHVTRGDLMDLYAPILIEKGLKGMIGKGARGDAVIEAMKRYREVYFAATGGAGALISKTIKRVEVVAYEDLGTEAIRKLEVEDFPAIVVGDVRGNDLYREGRMKYRRA